MKLTNYPLSISGLLSLLETLSKRSISNQKGYLMNSLDEINIAWAPLLMLHSRVNPFIMNKKIWPNHLNIFNGKLLADLSMSTGIPLLHKNKILSFLPWTPFLTNRLEPIQVSLEKWSNSIYFNENNVRMELNLRGLSNAEIEAIVDAEKMFLSYILTYHSELYANSVTHGLHTKDTPSVLSNMTSFIAATENTHHIFHADFGTNIIQHIRENANSNLPEKMSNEEVLNWALKSGNSSKDPNKFKVRGLGSTIIKSLLLTNENAIIYCISGSYMAKIVVDSYKAEQIDIDAVTGMQNIDLIDEVTSCDVKKLKSFYPGTIWYITMPTNGNATAAELREIIDLMKKTNNNLSEKRMDIIKDFLV